MDELVEWWKCPAMPLLLCINVICHVKVVPLQWMIVFVQVYTYQQLRLTNRTLPPGVDKNALEVTNSEQCKLVFVMRQQAGLWQWFFLGGVLEHNWEQQASISLISMHEHADLLCYNCMLYLSYHFVFMHVYFVFFFVLWVIFFCRSSFSTLILLVGSFDL